LFGLLVGWLVVGWLVSWLVGWLVGWLVCWLVGWIASGVFREIVILFDSYPQSNPDPSVTVYLAQLE
jgi:hypothetical protein